MAKRERNTQPPYPRPLPVRVVEVPNPEGHMEALALLLREVARRHFEEMAGKGKPA